MNERPLIASVIYNRLQKNIPLGVDSSIIYASKLAGKWRNDGKVYKSDVERDSPYNTRIHQGLPPGPIASPSESSLKAAVVPAQTDYSTMFASLLEMMERITSMTMEAISKKVCRHYAGGNRNAMPGTIIHRTNSSVPFAINLVS